MNVEIVQHDCPICGSGVWPDSSNPDMIYCSARCAYQARRKMDHKPCLICGADISGSPSRIRSRRYCGRQCYYRALSRDMSAAH